MQWTSKWIRKERG